VDDRDEPGPSPTYGLLQGGINAMLRLTPPKHTTFYTSVELAIIAVLLRFLAYVGVHVFHGGFVILLIGYLVLLAGIVLEGV
jgi:hypothetical protein